MRLALSWLREFVDIPASETGPAVADRFVRAGFEVDSVEVYPNAWSRGREGRMETGTL